MIPRRVPQKGEIWHVNGVPVESREFEGAALLSGYLTARAGCSAGNDGLRAGEKRRRHVALKGRDRVSGLQQHGHRQSDRRCAALSATLA